MELGHVFRRDCHRPPVQLEKKNMKSSVGGFNLTLHAHGNARCNLYWVRAKQGDIDECHCFGFIVDVM